jgi:hypothetical protein
MPDGHPGRGAAECPRGPGARSAPGPVKAILRRIAGKGPVTFAEFLEVALWLRRVLYLFRGRWGGRGL